MISLVKQPQLANVILKKCFKSLKIVLRAHSKLKKKKIVQGNLLYLCKMCQNLQCLSHDLLLHSIPSIHPFIPSTAMESPALVGVAKMMGLLVEG